MVKLPLVVNTVLLVPNPTLPVIFRVSFVPLNATALVLLMVRFFMLLFKNVLPEIN